MPNITNALLFAVYTLASAGSMLVIKIWLPAAQSQWANRALTTLNPSLFVVLGIILYGASFAVWMIILARNELTIAYPVAIGLTLAVSTLAAVLVLGESLPAHRLIGMILILGGIILVVR